MPPYAVPNPKAPGQYIRVDAPSPDVAWAIALRALGTAAPTVPLGAPLATSSSTTAPTPQAQSILERAKLGALPVQTRKFQERAAIQSEADPAVFAAQSLGADTPAGAAVLAASPLLGGASIAAGGAAQGLRLGIPAVIGLYRGLLLKGAQRLMGAGAGLATGTAGGAGAGALGATVAGEDVLPGMLEGGARGAALSTGIGVEKLAAGVARRGAVGAIKGLRGAGVRVPFEVSDALVGRIRPTAGQVRVAEKETVPMVERSLRVAAQEVKQAERAEAQAAQESIAHRRVADEWAKTRAGMTQQAEVAQATLAGEDAGHLAGQQIAQAWDLPYGGFPQMIQLGFREEGQRLAVLQYRVGLKALEPSLPTVRVPGPAVEGTPTEITVSAAEAFDRLSTLGARRMRGTDPSAKAEYAALRAVIREQMPGPLQGEFDGLQARYAAQQGIRALFEAAPNIYRQNRFDPAAFQEALLSPSVRKRVERRLGEDAYSAMMDLVGAGRGTGPFPRVGE